MAEGDIFAAPHFQNDDDARKMLESVLWPRGPVCPHCGVVGHAYADRRAVRYRCAEKWCRKEFTVTMRTVMERSKIALHKWLRAFYLVSSSKRGVSAYQLHRTLNIGYEAAWFMDYRIREAMRDGGLTPVRAVARSSARSLRRMKAISAAARKGLDLRGTRRFPADVKLLTRRVPCRTWLQRAFIPRRDSRSRNYC